MAFEAMDGIGPGSAAQIAFAPGRLPAAVLAPCDAWLGRVIDPLGRPLDGRGRLPQRRSPRPVRAAPPAATAGRGWVTAWISA